MKLFVCWTALLFLLSSEAGAQQPNLPNIVKPSPATQAFEKYGNFPPGNFNGIPNIDIPLYTITEGDLVIPISLKYYAEGCKPSTPNAFVGMNWTLMAGGKISRTIVGAPDDVYASPPTLYSTNQLNAMSQSQRDIMLDGWQQGYDTEPDIFSYNFNGHSGQFFLQRDGNRTPLMMPYKPIQITSGLGSGQGLIHFNAIDEAGVKYAFAENEPNAVQPGLSFMSWDLSSMTSATDPTNTITFVSGSGSREYAGQRIDTYTIDDSDDFSNGISRGCYGSVNNIPVTKSFESVLPYANPNPQQNWSVQTTINQRVGVISAIYFKSGSVTFVSDELINDGMLQKIVIKDVSGNIIKTIEFVYHSAANSHRYELIELDFYDSGHYFINNYKFDYNGDATAVDYTAAGYDYWGFLNNYSASSTFGLLPYATINVHPNISGSQTFGQSTARLSNETAMKLGILNKITYPTGGYTTYDYEANRMPATPYYPEVIVGGLHVKTISNYKSPDAVPEVHSYEYAGGRMDFPAGLIEDYSYSNQGFVPNPAAPWDVYRERWYSSEASFNMTPHGSPVVYTDVTEYIGDGTSNTGKIQYSYDYVPAEKTIYNNNGPFDYEGDPIIYKQYLKPFQNWTSGNLISTATYKNVNGNYSSVSLVDNTFIDLPVDTIRALKLERYVNYTYDGCSTFPGNMEFNNRNLDGYSNALGGAVSTFNYGDYFITSAKRRLSQVEQTFFDSQGQNPVMTKTTYDYTNSVHELPTSKTELTSKGDSILTQYKYPHDFVSQQPYTNMVNVNHIWSPVVEQLEYKNSTANFLQSTKTDYSFWQNGLPASTATNQIYPLQVSTKNVGSSYESRIKYLSYDVLGNISSVSKTLGSPSCYLWAYQQAYPIASVTNAFFNQVAHSSFEEDNIDLASETENESNILVGTSSLPLYSSDSHTGHASFRLMTGSGSEISTVSKLPKGIYILGYWSKPFTPGNDATVTIDDSFDVLGNNSGKTDARGWQYHELTVSIASDDWFTIYPSNSPMLIDDVRIYPKDAQMTTYTYDPLVGMTSSTDAKGQTTYYEYDGFQRLVNVKDQDGKIIKHMDYHYQNQ